MHTFIQEGSLIHPRMGKVSVPSVILSIPLGLSLLSCSSMRGSTSPSTIPSPDPLQSAREILRKKGYWDALPLYYRAMERESDPEVVNLLRYELAMAALEVGERDVALDLLTAILEHDSKNPLALPLYQSLREPTPLPQPSGERNEIPPFIRVLITDPEGFTLETTQELFNEKGEKVLSRYSGSLRDILSYPFHRLSTGDGGSFSATLNRYPLALRLFKVEEGIVLEIPLEDYLLGVLVREMGPSFPLEALKAQAVLSRTFLYERSLRTPKTAPYLVRSDTSHQAFGIGTISPEIITAVVSTRGEILAYGDAPALVFFHADNGGVSEDPRYVWGFSLPYYQIQRDPFSNQVPPWNLVLSREELERLFHIPSLRTIELFRSPSGRVMEVILKGDRKVLRMKGNEFRLILGPTRLKSLKFRLQSRRDQLIFSGEGYGHGVGLSQWGARRMAESGLHYQEILSFYYPGTRIRHLPPEKGERWAGR